MSYLILFYWFKFWYQVNRNYAKKLWFKPTQSATWTPDPPNVGNSRYDLGHTRNLRHSGAQVAHPLADESEYEYGAVSTSQQETKTNAVRR
jgi:hypothetical protein